MTVSAGDIHYERLVRSRKASWAYSLCEVPKPRLALLVQLFFEFRRTAAAEGPRVALESLSRYVRYAASYTRESWPPPVVSYFTPNRSIRGVIGHSRLPTDSSNRPNCMTDRLLISSEHDYRGRSM